MRNLGLRGKVIGVASLPLRFCSHFFLSLSLSNCSFLLVVHLSSISGVRPRVVAAPLFFCFPFYVCCSFSRRTHCAAGGNVYCLLSFGTGTKYYGVPVCQFPVCEKAKKKRKQQYTKAGEILFLRCICLCQRAV